MSRRYGNIWLWFALVIDAIFIAMLIILFKTDVISIKWFFSLLIILVVIFLGVLLSQVIGMFNYSEINAVKSQKRPTSQMFQIRSRINRLLKERPNGDGINWDGGRYGREKIRLFDSPNGGSQKFYGVSAMLGHSRKWVVIIYSVQENDIVEYIGDPSPQQLEDPFFSFNYFGNKHKDSLGFGRGYDDRYDDRRGAVNVNFGGRRAEEDRRYEGDRRAKNGVDKAFDTLKRSN